MDSLNSPIQILEKIKQADPQRYRRLCSDARGILNTPVGRRFFEDLCGLCNFHEFSFVPVPGATAIDPLQAALREGAKIPLAVWNTAAHTSTGPHESGTFAEEHIPE